MNIRCDWLQNMLRIAGCVLIGAVLSACALWNDDEAPVNLEGMWITDAPRYAGCSFELIRNMIIFNTVNDESVFNFIRDIDTAKQDGSTLYTIEYKDKKGAIYWLAFYYAQGPEGESIRFKNQTDIIWTRRDREAAGAG